MVKPGRCRRLAFFQRQVGAFMVRMQQRLLMTRDAEFYRQVHYAIAGTLFRSGSGWFGCCFEGRPCIAVHSGFIKSGSLCKDMGWHRPEDMDNNLYSLGDAVHGMHTVLDSSCCTSNKTGYVSQLAEETVAHSTCVLLYI